MNNKPKEATMKNISKIRVVAASIIVMVLAIFFPKITSAQEKATADTSNKVFEMSLEDLLNTSVTTVSKTAEKQSDAPGVISVITKDELNRFGGTTLKDVLERVPGLSGSSAYMTDRAMIAVRGDQAKLTSGHVLLLINGRPVRETLEGGISSEMFASFPVNAIDHIEVIKGPGSVLYGSDAFSGVVNIITSKVEKTGVSLTGMLGQPGGYGTSGEIMIKKGDLNILAAGKYYQKPEWNTDYLYTNASNAVITKNINIPDKGPGAYLGVNYKNVSFMSSYTQWNTEAYMPHQRSVGQADWKKTFANLGYDAKIIDHWKSSVNVTYTQAKFAVDSTPKISRNSHELVAEWTNFIDLGSKSKLIIGGLFDNISGKEISKATNLTQSDTTRSAFGMYAQIDYRLFESLKFIGGVQINKTQNIKMGFVPRVGIIWYPFERLSFKALYSEAFRAPSINELSVHANTTMGDPNLNPEKMKTIDISLGYQGEKIQADVSYFNSKASDIISRKNRPGLKAIYANLGSIDFQGIEFSTKFYMNKDLYLTGSVLYQENKDNNGVENVTPIANLGTKAGVSYVWNNAFTLSFFDIYQGTITKNLTNSINPHPGPYNLLYLHSQLNLNKTFKLALKQEFSIFLQADNLLGQEIWVPTWGLSQGLSMPYNQGRTIYLGVNLAF